MDNLKSTSVKELATALSKAQAEIRHAIKDGKNLYFESDYATLASTWDACRIALTKNGLSVIQLAGIEGDRLVLKTTLLHLSGECITGEMPILFTSKDMQGYGSAFTYARRYSLAAMVGIAPEDDDGNTASRSSPPQRPVAVPSAAPFIPSVPAARAHPVAKVGASGITEAQEKRLFAIGNGAGWAKNEITQYVKNAWGVLPRELTRQQYDALCDQIIPKMTYQEAEQARNTPEPSPQELTESDVFL